MEEIDLRGVAKTFWRKKIHIIIILILFLVLGFVYTYKIVVPKYTAKTTLILANGVSNNKENGYTDAALIDKDITVNSKLVSTYSELIKSKNVLRQVKTNLDIDIDEEDLKKMITVDTVEDTELIRISVEDENSELASYIANETANIFKEYIKGIYEVENVQIIDIAEVENEPSNIHHKRDIVIFGLIGAVVSAGYVLVLNLLDTTIKSIDDVESVTGISVLAALPILDNNKNMTKGRKESSSKSSLNSRTKAKRRKGGNKHE